MNGLKTGLAVGMVAAIGLAACGSDASDTAASGDGAGGIAIEGAWARTSPMMADAGAAYMVITSASDDALIGVSVDSSIAGDAQIHETVMVDPAELEGDDSMSGDDMSDDSMSSDDMSDDMSDDDHSDMGGVMQMREMTSLALPAGEAVALAPGGYHIMLVSLAAPLEIGQTFDVTLDFEDADDQVVTVEVLDEAPAS